ncbi:LysR substrate-binding domain-containing protein [Afifella sp. H1R]|uniref:LysR substrate-binding domain-containing protein n=1 Tax=Afifella sp. H1R TaxID=2908841 RepID=UPI001F341C44|nr:LysR substrate-binding domain-containing protein [Afifella sp. H1R]MCF1503977.1 LysR substrate-binding domain-containing protein [Afifella sp. H1R]
MHFDLTDLRLFVAVSELGSMAEAARLHHISVSALHERMKILESRAGVPLLERTARGSKPTRAGLMVAGHARAVLLQAERLDGAVEAWKQRESGLIKLRANSNAITSFLPDVLASFLARHPDVIVDLEEDTSDEIATAVRSGDADIGIAAENAQLDGIETIPILSDRLVFIAPAGHPLAQRSAVTFTDLLDESFITLDTRSAISAHLKKHAHRLGRELTIRIRVRSFGSVCRMVAAGAGVSIVPASVIPAETLEKGAKVIAISDDWSQRDLVICLPRDRPVSNLVRRLADAVASPQENRLAAWRAGQARPHPASPART